MRNEEVNSQLFERKSNLKANSLSVLMGGGGGIDNRLTFFVGLGEGGGVKGL